MTHTSSMAIQPPFQALPRDRRFSSEFRRLRDGLLAWMTDYYDREHLIRAGDWILALAPDAPEYLVLAALAHDLERAVPGGPVLDRVNQSWDDAEYNAAHTGRSAEIVSAWLGDRGAPPDWVEKIRQPIREHEFGGSSEGDLMQAADSISFLEANHRLVAGWITSGAVSYEKGVAKLEWMRDRVRLETARPEAARFFDLAVAEVDRQGERARRGIGEPTVTTGGLAGASRHVPVTGIRLHFLEYGDPAGPDLGVGPRIPSPAAARAVVA